ncbi:MAG: cupin domain-containing protein [Candidatus Omnitrophica bacterium]|nr:cupin domain-containing protein [Candidatus Omnitrophota bacterium]
MTGTLDSHTRIAAALGIHLPDLYKDVLSRIEEMKEKAARRKLETFSHSSGAVAQLLTTGVLQKKMTPILLKLKGKGHTETEEFSGGAERFIYILKGTIELTLGNERQVLKHGASLYFQASLPHHFRNPLNSESWCLSVLTPSSL